MTSEVSSQSTSAAAETIVQEVPTAFEGTVQVQEATIEETSVPLASTLTANEQQASETVATPTTDFSSANIEIYQNNQRTENSNGLDEEAIQTETTNEVVEEVIQAETSNEVVGDAILIEDSTDEQNISDQSNAIIEDETVALSDTVDKEYSIDKEEENVSKSSFVDIADEDTALASGLIEEPITSENKPNLWWLLIIAIFGAAGKKMYSEYMKDKEEKETDK